MNVVNVVPMMRPQDPPPPKKEPHVTVLRREVVSALAPRPDGLYVDATLGAGGHAEAILDEAPGCRLIGLDRDQRALELARARLARFGDRVTFVHARFAEVEEQLGRLGVRSVDGLVADIGVSSMQLEDPARGMSFRAEGPLDMRMDEASGETALELIERLDDDELANVIYHYGEERRSRRVARCIKQALEQGELKTTLDLRRAVVRAVGPARVGGVDPATRTFQALRVAVNGELSELEALIEAAPRVIAPGGVIAIISFHSLEDRIVKHALRGSDVWSPLTKKPVVPSEEEVEENPRARSAKLRAARRVEAEEASA
ncbi:16S rRNA (cytosine(1402)-N(4))-methyltransferase RsmH [Polyangium aurulentum]|uniref:16S rRNA (cytosine(1402)-N(4))-methyltransferase RsmH n=1 Tax=Polyangium aurulentum TaxID=2567896 RepID=UPI0010ADBC72|nr:16S rRNA (cytosine(1402)-N(4))-methyltransferase RsmH [Polyangium aurulentum]UQA60020.1 16S rRNA (cytosine(1402)-N(4))-methyltransferase RsmH [Polyangium aurulentum]